MPTVKNLTVESVKKIQIDEGLIFLNFGVTGKERLFAPTRGGGEFSVTNAVRDIEFDGRRGKTKNMQVVEEQAAILKVTVINSSQENLALGIPGVEIKNENDNIILTNSDDGGLIDPESYIDNVTMFAKCVDKTYKKITIKNALHEGAFAFKAAPKTENEHALEFGAHFNPFDTTEKIWQIEDVAALPATAPPPPKEGINNAES
ncbi:MAG: hypothetical protein FWF15_05555 [Oscillospiraceae bacterium]|nr:hypothetical protein [Oscillospiraceae bacterium]